MLSRGAPYLALLLALGLIVGAVSAEQEKPIVVATTTVLGSVVEDLAGDRVQLIVLVNPSICPAHYDVKPSDAYAISEAKLIFYHGMEGWLKQLYEASGSEAKLVQVSGGWATPDGVASYYQRVAEALKEELGLDVSDRLEARLRELEDVSKDVLEEAERSGVSEVRVIAMSWQRGFVEWMGFDVVGEFGPPEKLSSADIEELVAAGRENGVGIVVSNLQSGVEVGGMIARELGAVHVVLSNFPETDPETKTLIDLMKHKSDKLLEAVKLLEVRRGLESAEAELEFYRSVSYSLVAVSLIEAAVIAYLGWRLRKIG